MALLTYLPSYKHCKILISKSWSVLFVAMATIHLILQRFLFLDQVIQELYSKYDAMNWL